jgi:predicted ATPase
VKPLGPVPVKGLEAPIDVYELVGAGPHRSRLHAAAARGFTRFVGRDAELEQLGQALSRADAGHGQAVAIVGEPGVGKSRLVWEVTHSHRIDGRLILQASSVSYGKATPYLPVIDLLNGYFGIEARDDPQAIREKVTGKLLTLDRRFEPALPALLALLNVPVDDAAWLDLDRPQRRQRTLETVKRLLLRETQRDPVLVVVEDLQWIDSETQALLDGVIDSLPTARLLLLVNYRPEYQHGWGSKTYYTQIRIDPLPSDSAEALLDSLLGADASLERLKRRLIERTGGNPVFLEESVRTLVETAILVGDRGAYRLARPVETVQVPATVQAVLAARIDRLPPEEKRLLQTASVIGKDVPLPLLQAISETAEGILRRDLTHLQAAEFLYEVSLVPELGYTFKHALTHEVAYSSVLLEQRKLLHERTAGAVAAVYRARLAEHYGALAHHYSRSANTTQAIRYLELAGLQSVQRAATTEAIGHFGAALDRLDTLPESPDRDKQELALRIALGSALTVAKGWAATEVETTYTRALELCHRLGDGPPLFPDSGECGSFMRCGRSYRGRVSWRNNCSASPSADTIPRF